MSISLNGYATGNGNAGRREPPGPLQNIMPEKLGFGNMCGRFVAFSSGDAIADRLGLAAISDGARLLGPSWNVAPTNQIKIITRDASLALRDSALPNGPQNDVVGTRKESEVGSSSLYLEVGRWGLVTPWDFKGPGIINARVETVAEKPAFAGAFAQRRCIVPVDGYYEWQKTALGKQPWFITGLDNSLYFAGIYNQNEAGANVAILTMGAGAEVAPIHHRMPISFSDQLIEQWIFGAPNEALALMGQADKHFLKWEVGHTVNSVRNNGPALIEKVHAAISLF